MSEKKFYRVFIENARLSYPHLDKPAQIMGSGDPKYQATFLMEPDNPSVARIKKAIVEAANAAFEDKAPQVLRNAEKLPLKNGDDKANPPAGYAGMLYLGAKSKQAPDLRDSSPKIRITDPDEIRSKFVPGYRVNAYVDIFPYEFRNGNVVVSKGLSAGLVSVQFVKRDESFGGGSRLADDAYPDYSSESTAGYDESDLPF